MSGETQVVTFTAHQKAELIAAPADAKPLEANEIAGRTLVSLISPGTELNMAYLGDKFPQQPGYAGVFEVDRTGSGVTDIKSGDVVFCTGPNGIGGHRSRQRCVREAAIPLPAGLSPEVAAHARLMGVSMTTLVTTAARPPDKVMVMGLGPVGHLAAQVFQSCGYRVLAVDPVESRRNLVAQKGVKEVFPSVPQDKKLTENIGLVVECSGHEQAVLDACKAVRKKGEVVIIGVPWKRRTEVYAHDLLNAVYRGYVVLRSGWEWELPRYAPADFRTGCIFSNLGAALNWLAEGRIKVDGLYGKESPLDCQRVYQALAGGTYPVLSAVFDWS